MVRVHVAEALGVGVGYGSEVIEVEEGHGGGVNVGSPVPPVHLGSRLDRTQSDLFPRLKLRRNPHTRNRHISVHTD